MIIPFPLLRLLDNSGNGCRWMSSTTFDVELKGSHFSFVYLKVSRQFVKRILTLQAKRIKFLCSLVVTSLFTFQMKSDRIKHINTRERCCGRLSLFLVCKLYEISGNIKSQFEELILYSFLRLHFV